MDLGWQRQGILTAPALSTAGATDAQLVIARVDQIVAQPVSLLERNRDAILKRMVGKLLAVIGSTVAPILFEYFWGIITQATVAGQLPNAPVTAAMSLGTDRQRDWLWRDRCIIESGATARILQQASADDDSVAGCDSKPNRKLTEQDAVVFVHSIRGLAGGVLPAGALVNTDVDFQLLWATRR